MQTLAVKYRPKTLNDILGQDAIVRVLKRQIETGNIKNAYLFCGPSGNGKTTAARCFTNALNNGVGEPIEIDAASNNGVENIRQITQESRERSLVSKYKVYIIDEAHALSNAAWQAFLKSIEEPPELTIYIFCTTDPQKIPQTILNRVQRFNFNKLSPHTIEQRLEVVCRAEGYTNYLDSINYISKCCGGCMREALSLLGKVADENPNLNIDSTLKILGDISYDVFVKIINAFIDGDESSVLSVLDTIDDKGQKAS